MRTDFAKRLECAQLAAAFEPESCLEASPIRPSGALQILRA